MIRNVENFQAGCHAIGGRYLGEIMGSVQCQVGEKTLELFKDSSALRVNQFIGKPDTILMGNVRRIIHYGKPEKLWFESKKGDVIVHGNGTLAVNF